MNLERRPSKVAFFCSWLFLTNEYNPKVNNCHWRLLHGNGCNPRSTRRPRVGSTHFSRTTRKLQDGSSLSSLAFLGTDYFGIFRRTVSRQEELQGSLLSLHRGNYFLQYLHLSAQHPRPFGNRIMEIFLGPYNPYWRTAPHFGMVIFRL